MTSLEHAFQHGRGPTIVGCLREYGNVSQMVCGNIHVLLVAWVSRLQVFMCLIIISNSSLLFSSAHGPFLSQRLDVKRLDCLYKLHGFAFLSQWLVTGNSWRSGRGPPGTNEVVALVLRPRRCRTFGRT